ncbi:hypothetical protein B0H14DRAFT_3491667 [Mycena olivaceomarginata]|nr:hypothetical protein B0H14DRAFT_3491667 [Mycena olivaceomarginata]
MRRTNAKTRRDSAEYNPARTPFEKKQSRRVASAAYYVRNPHLREVNRVKMQERRAAVKDKRRQWDPPKPICGVVRFRGKDDDGISIVSYHFKDWRGATESVVAPSDFYPDGAYLPWALSSEANSPGDSVDNRATPDERVALEALAMMAGRTSIRESATTGPSCDTPPPVQRGEPSDRVRLATASVRRMNEGPFTTPTSTEEMQWVRGDSDYDGRYLLYKEFRYIFLWIFEVNKCT